MRVDLYLLLQQSGTANKLNIKTFTIQQLAIINLHYFIYNANITHGVGIRCVRRGNYVYA